MLTVPYGILSISVTSLSGMKMRDWKKVRYLLPSIFTMASVFCAITSISLTLETFSQVQSGMEADYTTAAIFVLFSTFFDLFDGKIARLTKSTSQFGMELDSLADAISFGAAPAVLVYAFALHGIEWWGRIAVFIYLGCVLLRLARFNVEATEKTPAYFKGLSSPAGAVIIVSLILASESQQIDIGPILHRGFIAATTATVGLLMVSGVKYRTFKDKNARQRDILFILVGISVFALMMVLYDSYVGLFFLILYYTLSGVMFTIANSFRHAVGKRLTYR